MKAKTTEEFINECKLIYGDTYDYSLVDYKNNKQKIKIICKDHDEFEQRASSHLRGSGCKKCSDESFINDVDIFIKKAIEVHGNKYDYSLVQYTQANKKVKIICPEHREFEQLARKHLKGKTGCPYCGGTNKKTTEDFIKQSIEINGDKYDYSLCNYIGNKKKVKLICKEHDFTFETTALSHLKGKYSCPLCNNRNHRLNKIKMANENKLSNYQISPLYNKKACKLFDDICEKENIHIQHAMNGGEYYIKELGYWLDGYDEMNNIAYEYDEKHHFKNGKLKEKDINRQNEISNYLKCKFIRIKYL